MAQKINVLVSGCSGKMGKLIVDLVNNHPNWEVCCGYDAVDDLSTDFPIYNSFISLKEDIGTEFSKPDIIIDFSNYTATEVMYYTIANEFHIPIVVGTTKLPDQIIADMKRQYSIPVFQSANMSYGIKCFTQSMCTLAKQLGLEDYDIDIEEEHHSEKLDAPSGTAINLANTINATLGGVCHIVPNSSEPRKPYEIRILSSRRGSCPGKHTVIFASKHADGDCLRFSHEAFSRAIFAKGAIKAAEFLLNQKPGFYNMDNLN